MVTVHELAAVLCQADGSQNGMSRLEQVLRREVPFPTRIDYGKAVQRCKAQGNWETWQHWCVQMENIIINMCHEKRPFRRKSSLPKIVFQGLWLVIGGVGYPNLSKDRSGCLVSALMFFLQGTRSNWESESTPAMCEICDLRFQAIQNVAATSQCMLLLMPRFVTGSSFLLTT